MMNTTMATTINAKMKAIITAKIAEPIPKPENDVRPTINAARPTKLNMKLRVIPSFP